jgi:hypothetical protein
MIVDPAPDTTLARPGNDHRDFGQPRQLRGPCLAVATCAAAALSLAACAGPAKPAAQSAVARACQEVTAMLADGTDPGSDAVGYAEAQILPLRQVRTADRDLRSAISQLARAYGAFFAARGKSAAATSAVVAAAAHLSKLCPGAGATE